MPSYWLLAVVLEKETLKLHFYTSFMWTKKTQKWACSNENWTGIAVENGNRNTKMWGLLFIYLPEIVAAGTWLQVRHSLFFPDTQTSQNFDSIYIQNYNHSALWLLCSDLQSMPLLDPLDHELGFPLATVKGKWFVNIKWIAHLLLTRWEHVWRYYHHYVKILSGCECVSNKCGVELDLMYWQDAWTQAWQRYHCTRLLVHLSIGSYAKLLQIQWGRQSISMSEERTAVCCTPLMQTELRIFQTSAKRAVQC